jgi:deoxyribodipyrimidine photolyase-related protein
MDAFYRRVRQDTGILMEDGSPLGGQYSHDGDNREFWPGEPEAPELPTFDVDEITAEVFELVDSTFAHHPGSLEGANLPVTQKHADDLWEWAKAECMEHFGPYEDAMSTKSRGIFHTRISPLLNLHRLLPETVVEEVERLDIPLNSKEGFIRQVIGWREFMRHVHIETDGFRDLPDAEGIAHDSHTESRGTDGGWGGWSGETWDASAGHDGASPSFLGADRDVPPAFWGAESGMNCLDTVVESVWDEGYSHHITRLMVLANIASLLDVSPRAITDWFWVAYIDAYDWVVEPNVLGMGTFGLGELFTTKPYVSGSNYINKMSDYCGDCAFHPKKNCPIGDLYWAFLERHHERLDGNRRMSLIFGSLKRRSDAKKARDAAVFDWVHERLSRGERLTPEDLPEAE